MAYSKKIAIFAPPNITEGRISNETTKDNKVHY